MNGPVPVVILAAVVVVVVAVVGLSVLLSLGWLNNQANSSASAAASKIAAGSDLRAITTTTITTTVSSSATVRQQSAGYQSISPTPPTVIVAVPSENALVLSILPAEQNDSGGPGSGQGEGGANTGSVNAGASSNPPTFTPDAASSATATVAADAVESAATQTAQASGGNAGSSTTPSAYMGATDLNPTSPTAASVTATPLPPVEAAPFSLNIKAISLTNSPVVAVGVEKLKQPDGSTVLRWQARDSGVGYQPANQGEVCKWGLVTLNGHNWFRRQPGVFVNLNKLKPGDQITVATDKGTNCAYTVEWSRQYGPTETSWLYEFEAISDPTKTYLNLYTCSSDFKERYVVRASLLKS